MHLSLKALFLLAASSLSSLNYGQTAALTQGFEAASPCNAWRYTLNNTNGVNSELVRNGTQSLRLGRNLAGEATMVTFATVDISALSGVTLEVYHAVRGGSGPGLDWGSGNEGAVIEYQLNGGPWQNMGRVNGGSDANWGYAQTGGNSSAGCGYTCPNPATSGLLPAGTTTVALRIYSTNQNACPSTTPASYSRDDEGFFIDDVSLKTTTSPLPAIWMGSTSTDWNTCTNWLYGSIPTATLPAIIDQRAVNDCVVSTATATAKSIAVSSNNATSRTLTISGSRTLNVINDVSVNRTVAGAETGIILSSGSFNCTNLTLSGSSAGARNAAFRNETNLNTALVRGNMTINTGGLLDLQGAAAGGTLQIQGNYTNSDQEAAFDEQFSTLQFQANSSQSINTPGFEERLNNLKMSKGTSDLTLNAPVSMRGTLSWASAASVGRIISTSTDLLTMEAGSSVGTGINSPGNSRFVSGPVRKLGNTDFTFPIGKGAAYRPALATGITNTSAGFSAEYFPASAQITFGTARETSLHHVSDCEYWTLQRTNGADDPYFWLSWATPNSCGVTSLPEMRVAYWNGAQWLDRGNGSTTGTTSAGTVRTEDFQSAYGNFTLASISAENPLPIQLLDFNAVPEGEAVHCTWTTATEADNDHFTVERSTDALAFDPIGTVPGAGNSQSLLDYSFMDLTPLEGLSYYRLRQTDHDGASTVTDAVPVLFRSRGNLMVTSTGLVHHDLAPGTTYQVFDPDGRLVLTGRAEAPAFQLPMDLLAQGIHLLRLSDGVHLRTLRFVR